MALEYFGNKQDLSELKKKLNYNKVGTSAYDNGSLLLDAGLKVTAVTAHPMLFPPDIAKGIKNNEDLLKIIREKAKKVPRYKAGLKSLETFLRKGGKMQIAIPTEKHIFKAVDSNKLVIALFYGRAVGSNEGGFHFVIITGYDEKNIYVNNPLPQSKQNAKYPIDQFLYALHTSTTTDIDNGTLLIISK
jgi:ABC-type bacteriocin/lantibiotic exporter with double-glycine peptidase domain